MSILPLHVLGSPLLRQETAEVKQVTDDLRRLVDDMIETMYAAKGIGLAAPQIGRTERLAVIDTEGGKPFAIINPVIVASDGSAKGEEGCLSIPDIYGDVVRPDHVTVRALGADGKEFEVDARELLARCLQHEIDHLDGKLFIDYLSVLRRRAAMAKWATLKARYPKFIRTLTPEEIAEHHHRDEEL